MQPILEADAPINSVNKGYFEEIINTSRSWLAGASCSQCLNDSLYNKCFALACFKALQDFAVYLNQLLQYPERTENKLVTDTALYKSCCYALALALLIVTLRTFTRFMYKMFKPNYSEKEFQGYFLFEIAAAIIKAAVKATSLQLRFYLTPSWPLLVCFAIFLGIAELALFMKDKTKNNTAYENSSDKSNPSQFLEKIMQNLEKIMQKLERKPLCTFLLITVLAFFYALATAFTYATSIIGFLKHIEVLVSEEWKYIIGCSSYIFACVLAITTFRFIHDKLMKKLTLDIDNCILNLFFKLYQQFYAPYIEPIEIICSTAVKTLISATSLAAWFYSFFKDRFDITLSLSYELSIIISCSTVLSGTSQFAGLVPHETLRKNSLFKRCFPEVTPYDLHLPLAARTP